jgi:hypothetical protein
MKGKGVRWWGNVERGRGVSKHVIPNTFVPFSYLPHRAIYQDEIKMGINSIFWNKIDGRVFTIYYGAAVWMESPASLFEEVRWRVKRGLG